MKTPDPSATITATLEKISAAENELQKLAKLVADTAAQMAALELSVDLADAAGLAKIGQLQTITMLIPRRQSARETALAASQDDLLKTCHEFIAVILGPRIRAITERIRAKVKAELKPYFLQPWELEKAVEKTALEMECQNFQNLATVSDVPRDQVRQYAERLIQTWQDVAAFEKTHLA